MNKKTLIPLTIIVGALVAVGIYVKVSLDNLDEDIDKTKELSAVILDNFKGNKSIQDYPFQPSEVNWNTDYLILKEGGYEHGINITYSSDFNEKLGSTNKFPGDNVKGVVIIGYDMVEKGEYKSKIGDDTKAYQRNYIIRYFDLNKKVVIAQDTLYGDDPASTKRLNDAGVGGGLPSDDEIMNSIKKRVK
ncbi:MAG: hypothetical protein RSD71_11630 [Flavobacterium sp.]|uniref:hypothetical protein n=1 Tax=Flavobacterium sp. TaxID=239 RepID=UPI002FCC9D59